MAGLLSDWGTDTTGKPPPVHWLLDDWYPQSDNLRVPPMPPQEPPGTIYDDPNWQHPLARQNPAIRQPMMQAAADARRARGEDLGLSLMQTGVEALPGAGEAAALRDANEQWQRARAAYDRGDYLGFGADTLNGYGTAALGVLPFAGMTRQVSRIPYDVLRERALRTGEPLPAEAFGDFMRHDVLPRARGEQIAPLTVDFGSTAESTWNRLLGRAPDFEGAPNRFLLDPSVPPHWDDLRRQDLLSIADRVPGMIRRPTDVVQNMHGGWTRPMLISQERPNLMMPFEIAPSREGARIVTMMSPVPLSRINKARGR